MNTSRTIRGKMLIAMMVSLIASAPVQADDIKFLPDGCEIVASVDFAAFLKGKMYPAAKEVLRLEGSIESLATENGLKITNLGRVTFGLGRSNGDRYFESVRIVTALMPITAVQIREVTNRDDY